MKEFEDEESDTNDEMEENEITELTDEEEQNIEGGASIYTYKEVNVFKHDLVGTFGYVFSMKDLVQPLNILEGGANALDDRRLFYYELNKNTGRMVMYPRGNVVGIKFHFSFARRNGGVANYYFDLTWKKRV